MFSPHLHSRIHFILSCCIAFLLPFKQLGPVQVVVFCIAALMLNWLLEGNFRNKFKGMRHRLIFCTYLGFYLLHVIGLAWSVDIDAGLFDLQVKFSFLIFPWIFSTRPMKTAAVDKIFTAFLMGCALACVILLIRASYYYLVQGENKFYYEQFSWFMHPSYFSMYLNLGLIYLIFACIQKTAKPRALWIMLIPLFIPVVVLLSSKLGQISLVLILLGWLGWVVVGKRRYALGFVLLILFGVSIGALLKFSPAIYGRLNGAVHALTTGSDDKTKVESTAVRMLVWGSAREVISEHPLFGAGTGDSKRALMSKYKQDGVTGAYSLNLNAHNAYLQILVSLGLLGFLIFMCMMILPLIAAFREHKTILVCFTFLLSLNLAPESMLETQAGVMFIGFFGCLFVFSDQSNFRLVLPWAKGDAGLGIA